VDPDADDDDGRTALHFAAQINSAEVAAALLAAGAGVDPRDASWNTPLFTAVFNSRGEGALINVLRAHGADPFAGNKSGQTPVGLARLIANFDTAQYFSDLPHRSRTSRCPGRSAPVSLIVRPLTSRILISMRLALLLPLLLAATPAKGAAQVRPPAGREDSVAGSPLCGLREGGHSIVPRVSLVQLLANPERYHGCQVLVTGYLHLEFEGNGIYLSRDDQLHYVTASGFWVDFAPGTLQDARLYSDRYVTLAGTFNAEARGHRGMWSGTIEKITNVSVVHPREDSPPNHALQRTALVRTTVEFFLAPFIFSGVVLLAWRLGNRTAVLFAAFAWVAALWVYIFASVPGPEVPLHDFEKSPIPGLLAGIGGSVVALLVLLRVRRRLVSLPSTPAGILAVYLTVLSSYLVAAFPLGLLGALWAMGAL
jgi:uncharacterized protein